MTNRIIKRKLFKFKSNNFIDAHAEYYSNGDIVLVRPPMSHSAGKIVITANRALPCMVAINSYILENTNLTNKKTHILHLGVGLGYGLLDISESLNAQQITDCRLSGVDCESYDGLRPPEDSFYHKTRFYKCDAEHFIKSAQPVPDEFTILVVDLFSDDGPIREVYDTLFWKKIKINIDPDIIAINTCYGEVTLSVISQVFDISAYKNNLLKNEITASPVEVYFIKKLDNSVGKDQ